MISDLEVVLRLILSVGLGALIGIERQKIQRPAGLRTHMLVAVGSTLFTLASIYFFPGAEASRVAAQIVVGIGFIGAGTIFVIKDHVIGLTTAASLWAVAGIGLAVGCGFYLGAIATTILVFIVLLLRKLEVPEEEISNDKIIMKKQLRKI